MNNRWRRSGSLVGRLAFWFGVSAFAILLVASAFLYWVLKNNLEKEDRESLAEEIQVLRTILRERPHDRAAIEREVFWEGRLRDYVQFYKRVLDPAGAIVLESPGMNALLPATVFPPPAAAPQTPGHGRLWRTAGGKTYLLMAALGRVGDGERQMKLQAALDVSHEQALLAVYRRQLLLVLLLGVVVSAGAGALVAARGIAPLTAVTDAARRIGASELHARLDAAHGPAEVKALAGAFNDMLARLEDAFTRLSQFSADLAHELRTPIGNLMGEAEVMLAKPRAAGEYRQVLESALEEYGRLSRMIDSLLFLARAERAAAQVRRARLDARAELEAVREFYDALAQEHGVAVRCTGAAALDADPLLFRRALGNLLANALHHTRAGGQVDLSVEARAGATEVRVRDTGAGIAAEHLPHIFQRFYRADPARSSPGTGLGLAIVKSIVELHGGAVTVHSRPGEGSEFILRFPATAVDLPPPNRTG